MVRQVDVTVIVTVIVAVAMIVVVTIGLHLYLRVGAKKGGCMLLPVVSENHGVGYSFRLEPEN
jgi:hypothetical protein